ncbi:MAG: hypothetical protein ACYSUK_10960, partial [Planctomycetota bacterium]
MRPRENIEKIIKKFNIDVNASKDQEIFDELRQVQAKSKQPQPATKPNIWRIIMKSRITKLAAAAVIIIAVLIGVDLFKGRQAWAIEQTTASLENIMTITVSGKSNHIYPVGNLNILLKRDADNWNSFLARGESEEVIVVVDGNMRYEYPLGSGEIYAKDGEDFSGFWNGIIENAPWISPISPTMLENAKLVSTDWQEIYGQHVNEEQIERDCVFVTGSYKPLSVSFWLIF